MQAEAILGRSLFAALADMLEKIVTAEAQNTRQTLSAAEQSITTLKGVIDDLAQDFADDEDHSLVENLFDAVRRIPDMRKSQNLGTLLTMADDIRLMLVAQSKRLQAMQHAALDDAAVNAMADQLRELSGDDVILEPATAGKQRHCVGYWLHGSKASA